MSRPDTFFGFLLKVVTTVLILESSVCMAGNSEAAPIPSMLQTTDGISASGGAPSVMREYHPGEIDWGCFWKGQACIWGCGTVGVVSGILIYQSVNKTLMGDPTELLLTLVVSSTVGTIVGFIWSENLDCAKQQRKAGERYRKEQDY